MALNQDLIQIKNKIITDKQLIATALTNKGVDSTSDETFESFSNKISSIEIGRKPYIGKIYIPSTKGFVSLYEYTGGGVGVVFYINNDDIRIISFKSFYGFRGSVSPYNDEIIDPIQQENIKTTMDGYQRSHILKKCTNYDKKETLKFCLEYNVPNFDGGKSGWYQPSTGEIYEYTKNRMKIDLNFMQIEGSNMNGGDDKFVSSVYNKEGRFICYDLLHNNFKTETYNYPTFSRPVCQI